MGWANSSLRFLHQLPRLPPSAKSAKGVVLQDPLLLVRAAKGAVFGRWLRVWPGPWSMAGRYHITCVHAYCGARVKFGRVLHAHVNASFTWPACASVGV